MRPETNKVVVVELVDVVVRSWWTVVAAVCLGLAGGLFLLHETPKTYEASARILITPQGTDVFKTGVKYDPTRELMALEEAVLSENYMRQLIEQTHGLPATEAELRQLIRKVEGSVEVRPTATQQSGWLAFDIVYRDGDRRRTARVANTLAELYIVQTRDARIVEARETTRAVEQRVDEAKLEFETIDRQLQTFLAKHGFETESHLDANLRLHETAQRDLEHNLNNQSAARDRIKQLEVQVEELKGGRLTNAERLASLRAELDQLLISYSEAHPAVVRKKREIDEFAAAIGGAGAAESEPPAPTDPKLRALLQQVEDTRRELGQLETGALRLRNQIDIFQQRIQAVAQVQPQLNQIHTQHRTALDRLTSAQDKLDRAKESQFVEESRQAWQLELAARAEVPYFAVSPIPQRYYALGVLAGLVIFVGPLLALRLLRPPVASEAGLRALTDVPVLVSIPRIETPGYRGTVFRRFARNVALSMVSAGVLATAVFLLT